jgi:dTMP kinase
MDSAHGDAHPEKHEEELSATERMRGFLSGRFVVFDGPDGCGKSTQFRRFADWAAAQGLVVTEVREPGGTAIGERIRDILLDPAHDAMTIRCEMLLYMASRAQLLEERIRPALARGELVLADRFVSSTLAYQGTAGGMTRDEILDVARVAVGEMWPDEIVIFDVDTETAWRRMAASARATSRSAARTRPATSRSTRAAIPRPSSRGSSRPSWPGCARASRRVAAAEPLIRASIARGRTVRRSRSRGRRSR